MHHHIIHLDCGLRHKITLLWLLICNSGLKFSNWENSSKLKEAPGVTEYALLPKYRQQTNIVKKNLKRLQESLGKMTGAYKSCIPDLMKRHESIAKYVVDSPLSIRGAALGMELPYKFSLVSVILINLCLSHREEFCLKRTHRPWCRLHLGRVNQYWSWVQKFILFSWLQSHGCTEERGRCRNLLFQLGHLGNHISIVSPF